MNCLEQRDEVLLRGGLFELRVCSIVNSLEIALIKLLMKLADRLVDSCLVAFIGNGANHNEADQEHDE